MKLNKDLYEVSYKFGKAMIKGEINVSLFFTNCFKRKIMVNLGEIKYNFSDKQFEFYFNRKYMFISVDSKFFKVVSSELKKMENRYK